MNCPKCNTQNGIREIIYGLPIEPIDETKYAIGGCCVTEFNPTHVCVFCGFEINKSER